MASRPDIELTDELATFAETHPAEVRVAIEAASRRAARREFGARLAATGVVITDADRAAARARLDAAAPVSDEDYARRLAQLDAA